MPLRTREEKVGDNGCLVQGCDLIGGRVGIQFQTGGKCDRGGVWQFVYDSYRPTILKGDLVGLCVNGSW